MTPRRRSGLVLAVALSLAPADGAVSADPKLGLDRPRAGALTAPPARALPIVEYGGPEWAFAGPEPPVPVRRRPIPASTCPGSTSWIAE